MTQKVRTSRGETRFEILRVTIGSAVSSCSKKALRRYITGQVLVLCTSAFLCLSDRLMLLLYTVTLSLCRLLKLNDDDVKRLLAQHRNAIFHPYGEKSPVIPLLPNCRVVFPDVIICAIFYILIASIVFLWSEPPPKIGYSH